MKLTLTCEHGTRATEFDTGTVPETLIGDHVVRQLLPVCPYCDVVERPKAQYLSRGWVEPEAVES